VQERIDQVTK
jgi:hypothetical protein